MTANLIQYGAALVAFGCKLDFNSQTKELSILDRPSGRDRRKILDLAVTDISLFKDTANHEDGLSVLALADYTDGEVNPLSKNLRNNILNSIGVMHGDRFVTQVLALAKVQRSWHSSDEPNTCTLFGELCTHRGLIHSEGKKGRKSERRPEEFHPNRPSGIKAEQLITPALQALYDNIEPSVLVSVKVHDEIVFDMSKIDLTKLNPEQVDEFIAKLQEMKSGQ